MLWLSLPLRDTVHEILEDIYNSLSIVNDVDLMETGLMNIV